MVPVSPAHFSEKFLRKSVSKKNMENKTPDFAIFQNSRTRQSALWVKGAGEWKRCRESEYDPISVMALMLRASPRPVETLRHIAKAIDELSEGWE